MDEKLQNSEPRYVENDKTINVNVNVIDNMGVGENVTDIKSENITKTEDKNIKEMSEDDKRKSFQSYLVSGMLETKDVKKSRGVSEERLKYLQSRVRDINQNKSVLDGPFSSEYAQKVLDAMTKIDPPASFYDMLSRVGSILGYDVNTCIPEDLYSTIDEEYRSNYEYLKGVKTLSDCSDERYKKMVELAKEMGIESFLINWSVDISILKRLPANRFINVKHIKELMDSIETVGVIGGANVIINAKGEVVDGQHRAIALLLLGKPFSLISDNVADVDTVRKINHKPLGWDVITGMKSIAESGVSDYVRWNDLYERYAVSSQNNDPITKKSREYDVKATYALLSKGAVNFCAFSKRKPDNSWVDTIVKDGDKPKPRMHFSSTRYVLSRYILDKVVEDYVYYFAIHDDYYRVYNDTRPDAMQMMLVALYYISFIGKHIVDMPIINMRDVTLLLQEGAKPVDIGSIKPRLDLKSPKDIPVWIELLMSAYFGNKLLFNLSEEKVMLNTKAVLDMYRFFCAGKLDNLIDRLFDDDLGEYTMLEATKILPKSEKTQEGGAI